MKLSNNVPIDVAPEVLFEFVSDIEQVAPCLPGAQLDGRDGDDYLGSMKVRVGPITVSYKGVLKFEELDAAGRRAVMKVDADEVAGTGAASARIVTVIEPSGPGSVMQMETELDVAGKAAQFGQSTIQKISERMLRQFATNIEKRVQAAAPDPAAGTAATGAVTSDAAPTGTGSDTAGTTRQPPPPTEAEALNAFDLLVGPDARRWLGVAAAALIGLLIGYRFGRRG